MKKSVFIWGVLGWALVGCALLELASAPPSQTQNASSATSAPTGVGAVVFSTPAASLPPDVVAAVNGIRLTRADLNKRMALVQLATWLATGSALNDPEEEAIVDQWIDAELFAQKAAQAGVQASEDEAQKEIARLLNEAKLDETDLLRQLTVLGIGRDDFVRYEQRALIVQKYTNAHIMAGASEAEKLTRLSTWLVRERAAAKIEKASAGRALPKAIGVYAGAIAPNFRLSTLDGKELSLENQRGKAVVLNFWATWCGPCRSEMPALQQTYENFKAQGMLLWGIDVGETPDQVEKFAKQIGITFPLLLDRDSKTSRTYRVFGLPTTVFVGRDGVITDVAIGAMDEQTLEKYVKRVLK